MKKQKEMLIQKRTIKETAEAIRKATGVNITDRQVLGEHEGDTVENVIRYHEKGISIMPTTSAFD